MTPHEAIIEAPDQPTGERPNPIGSLARIIGQAQRFPDDAYGLGTGERAALIKALKDEKKNIAALKHGSGLESALFGRMVNVRRAGQLRRCRLCGQFLHRTQGPSRARLLYRRR